MLTTRATRGFALVEALVAIAILVAGLAGSATLLLRTVSQQRESGSRRTALRIATSIADQLRAARRPDGRALLAITGVDPVEACVDQSTSCASERAAARLISDSTAEVATALPRGAAVSVGVPDPLVPQYLISIDWPSVGGGIERVRMPVST